MHNRDINIELNIYPFTIRIFKYPKTKKSYSENKKKRIKKFKKFIKNNIKYIIRKSIPSLVKKLHLKLNSKCIYSTCFGFERRDYTALCYGFLSALCPYISLRYFNNKNNQFTYNIYPDFNRVIFDIKVNYVLSGRGFHLILIIFILLQEILIIRKNTRNKE
ncbi:MAG: DUF2953 domain-containing protein [Clostridium sp.]